MPTHKRVKKGNEKHNGRAGNSNKSQDVKCHNLKELSIHPIGFAIPKELGKVRRENQIAKHSTRAQRQMQNKQTERRKQM